MKLLALTLLAVTSQPFFGNKAEVAVDFSAQIAPPRVTLTIEKEAWPGGAFMHATYTNQHSELGWDSRDSFYVPAGESIMVAQRQQDQPLRIARK